MSPAPHPLEPDEHRRARQLYVLKSLTDRAHTLALKAADKAEAQLDAPDPAPEPEPRPRAPDLHQTFTRYARLTHTLVVAEYRIANNVGPTRRAYRPHGQAADPRRPQLHQFIHQITRNSPDRAGLRREAIASIDAALERDTARIVPAAAILNEICDEFGLPFDLAHLPDEFLEPPVTGPP